MFFGGIPFMHMGGGGFGGAEPEEDAGPGGKELNNSKFYELLKVGKDASAAEIKKAFFTLARTEHPDKGGDPDKFKEINRAYEVLSDPEKRNLYDRYGEEALEGGGGGPQSAEDVFSMLFGGGARRAPAGPKKTDDTVHPLRVTLEDLYCGKSAKIAVNRSIYEKDPEGTVMDRAGNRYTKRTERQVLDVTIERGMKNGQRVTFPGMGDQIPGHLPGDVVLVLEQKQHDGFQRKGSDLIIKREISLQEALMGVKLVIEHLDGHKVFVTNAPGEVIAPDMIKQVADEGMPVYGHSHMSGVLFIQFEVKFPEKLELTEAMRKVLAGILPGPAKAPELEHGMVEGMLDEPDMEARRARERLAKDAYDSDEEGGGASFGGQRVQCANQ